MKKFWSIVVIVCCAALPCAFAGSASDQLVRARDALFVTSDLDAAHSAAQAELTTNPSSVEAGFLLMEAASLQADTAAELDAALRLCETKSNDERVTIAAARVLDLAANTAEFRAVLPRIQALLADYSPQASYLRAALLSAAADGAPGLPLLQTARDSGLLTDWTIAGPFGRFSNVDFDRAWPAEADALAQSTYGGRPVERFGFEDGNVSLPDYFDRDGVVYGASVANVPVPGNWLLRVESPGTLEVFVDGTRLLLKDDRFRATPEIALRTLWLNAGAHRVLVKFIAAATPFRVALLPAREQPNSEAVHTGSEAETLYVAAAAKYWSGDYEAAITALETVRARWPSALADYLLAQAWSHVAQDSPEQPALLTSALKRAPTATAAEYELAALAYSDDRTDEALARVRRVMAVRPEFAAGQELMSETAVRLNWRAEATEAMAARLRVHPSCSALREAIKFYGSSTQYEQAQRVQARLQDCAPGSLAYAESLSEAGRHAEAAQAASTVVAEHPFDREAHALLVRELALTGQTPAARKAAKALIALAPNSESYRRLAATVDAGVIVDDEHPRAAHFADAPFYSPYRRNTFQVLKDTANRHYSGGPAVTLLNDRVARLAADGTAALYVHKLTRVLTRDGIERYGEVALPGDADILELRTLKPDGSIAEPELMTHKNTTSMPALAPGDVVEQEYVQYFRDGIDDHAPAFQFVFGSFHAPIVYSRFVVLWPANDVAHMQISTVGPAPEPQPRNAGDATATVWEQNDIPQSSEEASMPRTGTLPTVSVSYGIDWTEIRDHYRDAAIEATRIGSRGEQAVAALKARPSEDKARELYRYVVSNIRSAGAWIGSGDATTAEDTLASHSGSRTAALLALARAAGLHVELVLARDAGSLAPQTPQLDAYTRPLVRFRFDTAGVEKEIVVDAETEGMAFGGLPPTIQRHDALLVPIEVTSPELARRAIVSVPDNDASEQSIAEGDVTLEDSGSLGAHITIRMGATRAAQMRSILAGIEPGQRSHFFEQLALRIFPGSRSASGEVRNEFDLERPLEIVLACRAQRFFTLANGAADIDQLVPDLGLRKMYGAGYRRFPLYIDVPLFERATFQVSLPANIAVSRRPADLSLNTDFGEYSVTFRPVGNRKLEITRSFRVPAQVVPPERFAAFSRFSMQIDDAERQRITLTRAPGSN